MLRDVRESVRSLAAQPGFTAVVILTLALGVGVNTTIFTALNGVLLQPLDYAEPDRLVSLWENNQELGLEHEPVSAATYLDWRNRSETFADIAAYRYGGFTLMTAGEPVRVTSVEVSPALFRVLGTPAWLGRTFLDADEQPGNEHLAILSYAAWASRFESDRSIVNSTVRLDGEPYTVVGVMPPGFGFPAGDDDVELWSPLTLSLEAIPSRPHRSYDAIGKLAPTVTLQQAQHEMDAIAAAIAMENPESNAGWGVALVPTHEQLVGPIRSTLWFLFGAVALVLLIGCANIANLLMARSTQFQKDFAVRAAFGASASALLRRSATESLVLATAGGAAGLLIAVWGVAFLRGVIPAGIPRAGEIGIDLTVLGFTGVASAIAGIAFGLVPAVRAMSPNLVEALQASGPGSVAGRKTRRLTNAMVTSQVALTLVLLAGAGLMIRTFAELTDVDPGFRKANVLSVAIALPPSRYAGSPRQRQFFVELVNRVRQLRGVEAAGAVSALPMSPLGIAFQMPFSAAGLEASSPSERPRAEYRAVIPGYFEAMGIPLLQGRVFDNFDQDDARRVVMINESLRRRYFADRNPIGQWLRSMPMLEDLEIVGVVSDVRHAGLDAEPRPELFVPFVQLPLSEMQIVAHTFETTNSIASLIKAEVLALDPELPTMAISSIDELLSISVAQPRFNMVLLAALAFCALALAAVGIYGVVSYSVARRTGEIGLRIALGAGSSDTVWLVVRQILGVVLLGVVLGLGSALAVSRFIGGMLYGVTATDPITYLLVATSLVFVGLVAAAFPAIRATRVDPVIALRQH